MSPSENNMSFLRQSMSIDDTIALKSIASGNILFSSMNSGSSGKYPFLFINPCSAHLISCSAIMSILCPEITSDRHFIASAYEKNARCEKDVVEAEAKEASPPAQVSEEIEENIEEENSNKDDKNTAELKPVKNQGGFKHPHAHTRGHPHF
ncbi:hypothetical protein CWI38_0818p0010 [Hamiltosporidium tvaerminnensis]|uniref:Uncharacterized protein n=1 Tax=Hamiltosporidium tvaerminnensis TaxID=1176355 RepID=A0A4Q9LUN9_9MICR|nr:hypothetical protein CWI38_0818p0010 [Hamiltosporidium tvaerminnensis]